MILNKKIWAFIPARAGSKSIKDKNIKNFCGKPLIFYTFKVLEKVKVDRVIFSTDSNKYIKIAKKFFNFEEHFRSKKNSKDLSTDLEVFQEFISLKLKQNESLPEFFLHLRPTTPFRRPDIVNRAINKFMKIQKKYSALRSISKLSNTGFRTVIIKKKILYSMYDNNPNLDKINIARQNFLDTFIANGYVDIVKTKTLLKNFIHGSRVYPFLTEDFNSDIDTLDDFNNFETILKSNVYFRKYFLHSRNRNKS
jgi:CMP-N-acetylneuraminic acid synthetase